MAEYYPESKNEPEEPEDTWEQVPPEPLPEESMEAPAEEPSETPEEPFTGTPAEAPTEETVQAFTPPEPEMPGAVPPSPAEEPSAEQAPAEEPSAERAPAGPSAPVGPAYTPALSPSDERTWAMLAHLSVLLNLVTGFLGPVAALLIYLIYKDRSRYVGYHAMQSFVFQMVWWVGGVALITLTWIIVGGLSALLVGLLCIPFAILGTIAIALLPLGALVYGVIGAIQVSQGQDFRYWLISDWVRGTLSGV